MVQELVFIGVQMDAGAAEAALEWALLSDAEYSGGPSTWGAFEDPFRLWERLLEAEAAAEHDHDHDHDDEDDEEEGEEEEEAAAGP